MTDAHEGANSGEDSAIISEGAAQRSSDRPSNLGDAITSAVGLLGTLTFCLIWYSIATRNQSLSHRLLAGMYCCVGVPAMIYNAYRVFWVKQLPPRWTNDNPRVALVEICRLLAYAALFVAVVGIYIERNTPDRDQMYGVLLSVISLQWCFSGYLADRMPLPPTLATPDPTKPEAPMTPLNSDHWGKRETP